MRPLLALHLTIDGFSIKVGRLVAFYCISPHCAGWFWYRPEANPVDSHLIMLWRNE